MSVRQGCGINPMTNVARILGAKRVIVKVGSSSVSGDNAHQIGMLVDLLVQLKRGGAQVSLVSSGAISTGVPFLQLEDRPEDLATQQAAAAVGQNVLVNRYQRALSEHNEIAGQVLLTAQDIENPTSRDNARRALERLLDLGIIPIINENDTVATHEIRFGDNDRLAALVSRLLGADALILLSDIDALYTAPPSERGAERIETVSYGDMLEGVKIGDAQSGWGTGGAVTKVAAARLATELGATVLLTEVSLLSDVLAGKDHGTWFEAAERHRLS